MSFDDFPADPEAPRKSRIAAYLRSRVEVRTHGGLIIFAAWLVACLVSWAMLSAGVDSMHIRYAVAILAGYAMFLLLVKQWVRIWRTSVYREDLERHLIAHPNQSTYDRDKKSGWDTTDAPIDGLLIGDGEGCLIAIFLFAVLAVLYFTVGYVIFSAEIFFADIVFESLVAAGVLAVAGKWRRSEWEDIAVRTTLLKAITLIVMVEIFASILTAYYPGSKSVVEAWHMQHHGP